MKEAIYIALIHGIAYSNIETKTTHDGGVWVPYWKW